MRKLAEWFLHSVDAINKRVRFIAYVFVIMTFVMMYEVIARFVFNAPTKWAWGLNEQLLCFSVMMAGGYILLNKAHVNMDFFYARWSTRRKAWVDLLTSFFPLLFCSVLLMQSFRLAQRAIVMSEYTIGYFEVPVYPIRVVTVVGVSLLLIQVLAEAIRNFFVLATKKEGHVSKN
ncbi:hypothetical protein ES703_77038 [subsurface metagenome]